jgi:hypothetical protein
MIEKHDLGKKIWIANLEKSINKIKKREKHKNSQKKYMESEISGLRQVICLELPIGSRFFATGGSTELFFECTFFYFKLL